MSKCREVARRGAPAAPCGHRLRIRIVNASARRSASAARTAERTQHGCHVPIPAGEERQARRDQPVPDPPAAAPAKARKDQEYRDHNPSRGRIAERWRAARSACARRAIGPVQGLVQRQWLPISPCNVHQPDPPHGPDGQSGSGLAQGVARARSAPSRPESARSRAAATVLVTWCQVGMLRRGRGTEGEGRNTIPRASSGRASASAAERSARHGGHPRREYRRTRGQQQYEIPVRTHGPAPDPAAKVK